MEINYFMINEIHFFILELNKNQNFFRLKCKNNLIKDLKKKTVRNYYTINTYSTRTL